MGALTPGGIGSLNKAMRMNSSRPMLVKAPQLSHGPLRLGAHGASAGILAAFLLLAACQRQQDTSAAPVEAPRTAAVNGSVAPASFPDIYERVSPAVVSINAATVASAAPVSDFPFAPRREALVEASSGSGFFISADGHILTNDHVIGRANRVQVVLKDGRRLPAEVMGRDPPSDLAVLKVAGRGFPHVNFTTAANPRVGEAVIAIGNPFGLGATATHGIVSAYGRDIGSPYVDFVQLDAAINSGNSGGPTFNAQGEVVGVNTAIFSPSGGSVGIGFAIPASIARDVSRQLIDRGRVERGFIGASIGDIPPDVAEAVGAGSGGAVVAAVMPGAPAQRAGLRSGDLIVAVDGKPVTGATDVIRRVTQTEAGDDLSFSLVRDGRRATVSVRPQRRAS